MRDELSQFYIAVASLCCSAGLASLEVELALTDGARITGVAKAVPLARRSEEELDETGLARALFIDDTIVDLAQVRACRILAPAAD